MIKSMIKRINKYYPQSLFAILTLIAGSLQVSAESYAKAIEDLVEKTMTTFQVPGVAIGIIKDGEVILAKGFGTADLATGDAVNQDTIFKIASNSKAFTAASLAILVDQGKLDWNDKVVTYLPDFQMIDPWITKEFNIIDLLTHRSGLGRFAGDLMIWPEPTKFSRADVVKNLRYLKIASSFRSGYAYDNLLYIVAGELVAAVSGIPWEEFVAQHIFKPLGMDRCYTGGIDVGKVTNLVATHVLVENKLIIDVPNLINDKTSLMAAAGGIKCSVSNLLSWVDMLLQGGSLKDMTVISPEQREMLWKSVTPLSISDELKRLEDIHYRGYALGWRVSDYQGHWTVSHTGTLSGSASKIILLPDQKLGIVILTNRDSGDARNALYHGLLQEFTTGKNIDWVDYFQKERADKNKRKQQAASTIASSDVTLYPAENPIPNSKNNKALLGTYIDPWFGNISINKVKDTVRFLSDKSPRLKGEVFFYKDNQWWVKWDNRSFNADAWLHFSHSQTSDNTTLLIEAISPDFDKSFDFKDLSFIRQ
ncbi:MAG: serine hydrolase [Gammaproteobacteria bacterium]|nr:serine hydrolase [Gammaproteobacteria bacterium]